MELKNKIEQLIQKPNFQKLWNTCKDKIDICKDCEYRYMCCDPRIPIDSGYLCKIILPHGLTTQYNKQIIFTHGLKVQANIITQNSRLIERFYHSLIKVVQ